MPIDTYPYQVSLNQQNENRPVGAATGQYPHPGFETEQVALNLSARDIESQTTPESVRAGLIDLYDDRSDLNYLHDEYTEPNGHGSVAPAEIEAQKTTVTPNEVNYHEVYKLQSTEQISKGISMTGKFMTTLRPIVLDEANRK